jgi:hypothetical protein
MLRFFVFVLSISTVFLFTGCMPGNDESKLWFYINSNANDLNDLPLKPSHFLYLQADGKYTCDFGVFEYGDWKRSGDKITLSSGKRGLTVLQVVDEDSKNLRLLMKGYVAEFESQPAAFGESIDPFAIATNQWRVHAEANENEDQLKQRLYNHCQFWEAYFNWGIENDLRTLDVRSTPTAIKIYGNGVGLKSYDELPQVWRSYFYDSTNCRQASDILKGVFRKHDIDWPKSDNHYVIFRSAFKQLRGFLKE